MKLIRISLAVSLSAVLLLFVALWLRPPQLLRLGANYSAKIVCSNVFLAGRDPQEILRNDVQPTAPGILRFMQVSVDRPHRLVRARLLGFIGHGLAVARGSDGCTVLPDDNVYSVPDAAPASPGKPLAGYGPGPALDADAPDALWPDGNGARTDARIDGVLAEESLVGPGMRAVLVIDHGRIVGERYGGGFSAAAPLLGWSMTKSVLAGLLGVLVQEGSLDVHQAHWWPAAAGDARDQIRIADLMAMSSGLRFNEDYGAISDITEMLYGQSDMAAFARSQPLVNPPGQYWSYSSGTANILARIAQDAAARAEAAGAVTAGAVTAGAGAAGAAAAGSARAAPTPAASVTQRLFGPLGMRSALIERDAQGTFVCSSYMYATARDWAKYAQLLLQDGVWRGAQLLPSGYVAMMASPVAASGGRYGRGLVWLWGFEAVASLANPDAAFGIPADTFWMAGHDGQSIAVIRSRQIAVIRLGLTPARLRYSPLPLLKAVLEPAAS